jgi:serine/threonine protein kinase
MPPRPSGSTARVHAIHDGIFYVVSELLEGETLRGRLIREPVPLPTALDWAAQLVRGLGAAHERLVVHDDLKPENVFLGRNGHLKLLDFGVAKCPPSAGGRGLLDPTLAPDGAMTGTGAILGTPGYMTPEKVRGEPVDVRSDVFSLEAILYELLAGRRAFPGGSLIDSSGSAHRGGAGVEVPRPSRG